ncbi:MAG: RNA polymerase sigma factor [Terriglobales bacterium]
MHNGEPSGHLQRMSDRVQLSDEELMEALMAGDQAALRPLVERHHANLLGFLYRMVGGDRRLAEDLVQDAFLRLIRQRTYAASRPFKPWLYAIASNLARDHFRASGRHGEMIGEDALADLADQRPGPEVIALERDTNRRVAAAMAALGHEYRAALILRFFHDMSLESIAQTLGIPIGTVKSRLSVGTRRLREQLANADSGVEG